jgi:hypothetical protein
MRRRVSAHGHGATVTTARPLGLRQRPWLPSNQGRAGQRRQAGRKGRWVILGWFGMVRVDLGVGGVMGRRVEGTWKKSKCRVAAGTGGRIDGSMGPEGRF